MADDRSSAQDGRVGIDDDIVLNGRMAFSIPYQPARSIGRETDRTQRYALINLDPFTNYAGLTDDDTGTVIDKEISADLAPG